MAASEEILGRFVGDASFPVRWDAEAEEAFVRVYDGLRIPVTGR